MGGDVDIDRYYGGYPVNISEDCLYLNIWSPINVCTSSPLTFYSSLHLFFVYF